jgi:pyridinium-3,5-bisthiocarboxylic acid mononucleotide nickel chelatase
VSAAPSELRGLTLYFDCASGIAGDMTLGALLDLGVPEDVVLGELRKLPVAFGWSRERVRRGALMGTKIHVHPEGDAHARHEHEHDHDHDHDHAGEPRHEHMHAQAHAHRHYRDIRAMLDALAPDTRTRARDIFDRIAAVEARLHGVSVEDVAFHEVGAIDSIVDIVGAAAALAWLAPAQVVARRVPLGGGTVTTAHGRLPVPAPATLELLAGAEVEAGGDVELTTPTGAAILAATARAYGPMPPLTPIAVGWGAGDRDLPDRPNLLRVVAGRAAAAVVTSDEHDFVVVEANVDDMNPELAQPLLDALFAAGAVDAWFTPIVMKKGRPALTAAALAPAAARAAVAEALLRESTSIGVRFRAVARTVLPRRVVEVDTEFGRVSVKIAGPDGAGAEPWNVAPEYEACRRAADAHHVPVKRVYAAALAAYYRR